MKQFLAVLLLAACAAAQARNNDIWELGHEQFRNFDATPRSPLVKQLLAEPIEYDLLRAEIARVALNIMRRTEEAERLNDYMEHDVVAGLLGLPHTKAATVGEAIAQQRARSTPVDTGTVNRAIQAALQRGATTNGRGRVFFHERHVMFGPDGISFGYPGNRKDSARTRAHELLFASTCADRGTCLEITAYFQKPAVRAALDQILHFVAVLLGGAILVLLAITLAKRFPRPVTVASVLRLAVKGFLIVIVLFSDVIQAGLISILVEHHNMPHGESRGFHGMGILALLFASLYVIVPATIISLGGMIVAFSRQTKDGNAVLPLVFYSFSTVLPLFVYWAVQWSDKG